jgi:hypothetical protein
LESHELRFVAGGNGNSAANGKNIDKNGIDGKVLAFFGEGGVGAKSSGHSISVPELNLVKEEKIAVPGAMDFEEDIAGTTHPLKFGGEKFGHGKIGLSS